MKKVDKEFLRELIKGQYTIVVEGMKIYKKNLEDNMKTIKHLELLDILPSFAYNKESYIADKKISSANCKLEKYDINKCLMEDLYKYGYDEKLVEEKIEDALNTINCIYQVNKNKIEKQTYGIYTKYDNEISQYKLKDEIEKISKIFRLSIDIDKMKDITFNIGLNNIDNNYDVKFYKNGKLQVIEK